MSDDDAIRLTFFFTISISIARHFYLIVPFMALSQFKCALFTPQSGFINPN